MTTEEIRKMIVVNSWIIRSDGIWIEYKWKDTTKSFIESRHLVLTPLETIQELIAMGEIDYYNDNAQHVKYKGNHMAFFQFMAAWTFSQWDALRLVMRHEYNKSVEEDVNNGDIGKAINNLLKK